MRASYDWGVIRALVPFLLLPSLALAQVSVRTPLPVSPASTGTTTTVSVEMKAARDASVVSRPCAWVR